MDPHSTQPSQTKDDRSTSLRSPIKKNKTVKVVDKEYKRQIKRLCEKSDVLRGILDKVSDRSYLDFYRKSVASGSSEQPIQNKQHAENTSENTEASAPSDRASKNKESAKWSHKRKKAYDILLHTAVVDMEAQIKSLLHGQKVDMKTILELKQQKLDLIQTVSALQEQLDNVTSFKQNDSSESYQNAPSNAFDGSSSQLPSQPEDPPPSLADDNAFADNDSDPSPVCITQFSQRREKKVSKTIPPYVIESAADSNDFGFSRQELEPHQSFPSLPVPDPSSDGDEMDIWRVNL